VRGEARKRKRKVNPRKEGHVRGEARKRKRKVNPRELNSVSLVKSEGCYALRPTPGSKPKMFLANGGGLTFPTDPLLSIPDTPDTLSQLETPLDNLSTCSTDDSNPF